MHELAITQSILKIALDAAAGQHARRIRAIRLTLGPFSGVVPDCVQMYLDVLAKGTIAEGAKIEARTLPLRVQCRACGQISEIDRGTSPARRAAVRTCTGFSGREFLVESLEVDV